MTDDGSADRASTTCFVLPCPMGDLRARYARTGAAVPSFSDYVFALAQDDRLIEPLAAPWPNWSTGFADLPLERAATPARSLAWRDGQEIVFLDVASSSPLAAVAPRQVLRDAVAVLHSAGLVATVGVEIEFVLTGEHTAIRSAYGMRMDDSERAFFSALVPALRDSSIDVAGWYREGGSGQWEIALAPATPLEAADSVMLTRLAISELAPSFGLTANFAPVFGEEFGNGLHAHLSLRTLSGDNVMRHGSLEGGLGGSAIAGILAIIPESTPLFAPTPESYARFAPHSAAGTTATWAPESRSVGIRHLERDDDSRIEIRVGSGDADPYLVLAAIIMGAASGVRARLPLPTPLVGDAYNEASAEQGLPTTLLDAATRFRRSAKLRGLFGDGFVDFYAARAEWAARQDVERRVTHGERREALNS